MGTPLHRAHPPELRIGHAERDAVLEVLKEAFAQGRLNEAELDHRMQLALSARTDRELQTLTFDLRPAVPPVARKSDGDRVAGAVAHALGAVTLFVGPFIMWLAFLHNPRVRAQAAEALNFQLTLLLITVVTLGIGGLLYAVAWFVCAIAAALALTGRDFRYPFAFRLVR